MGRREAKRIVLDGGVTWAGLRHAIALSRRTGMSRLNPSLSKAQALDVLWKAVETRDGAECVKPYAFVYGRRCVSGDALIAINVLRECGWVKSEPQEVSA
jgi:hypothetical protein